MGFDVNEFAGTVDQEFICGICLEVFQDPVNTPCGHTFCRQCIVSSLDTKDHCPLDRKHVDPADLSPVRALSGFLEKLPVKCPHHDKGCTFSSPRNALKEHIKVCEFDPNAQFYCQSCNDVLKRERLSHICYSSLREQIKSLELSLSKANDELTNERKEMQKRQLSFSKQVSKHEKVKEVLSEEIEDLEVRNQLLKEKIERLQKDSQTERYKFQLLLSNNRQEVSELRSNLQMLQDKLQELQNVANDYQFLEQEFQSLQKSHSFLQEKCDQNKDSACSLTDKHDQLELGQDSTRKVKDLEIEGRKDEKSFLAQANDQES